MENLHAELKAQYEAKLLDNPNAMENWQAMLYENGDWSNFKKKQTISWVTQCKYRRDPNAPSVSNTYKEIPYSRHPNADLITAIVNSMQGQVLQGGYGGTWVDESRDICLNAVINGFQSVIIKHNLKLIDWAKMPVGTTTSKGQIVANNLKLTRLTIIDKNGIITFFGNNTVRNLHLVEQTNFTYWSGGKCPVPEGVLLEVVFRDGDNRFINSPVLVMALRWDHSGRYDDIIAYRIIGLADGYTDNSSEAA